jgi:signal transduction histidine kinase
MAPAVGDASTRGGARADRRRADVAWPDDIAAAVGMGGPALSTSPAPERRTLAAAALVLEITTAAAGELELDVILRSALDRLHGVVDFTGGSIALVEGDDLVIRAAVGPFEAEAVGQRLPRGASASWEVIGSGEPRRFDDVQAEGRRATGDGAGAAIRSWLAVPILRNGGAIGLLEVDSTRAGAFWAEDERLLGTVAQALAGPIDLAARYADEQRSRTLRDAFVGVVSHELRTPITTIYGMSRVLRRRLTTMQPADVLQAVEDIEGEADRLRRLAEDLLVLSRAEGGGLVLSDEPLVVGHVVRRALAAERNRWPRHVFAAEISDDLPLVAGEDLSLEQVLRNLLGNAAKYGPEGEPIQVVVAPHKGGVQVRVLDRGPGLPEGTGERLFELFYRAPEAVRMQSGAGIGLFVCRQLVEAMHGRIWARQRPEGGAEFVFWLPALDEGAADRHRMGSEAD